MEKQPLTSSEDFDDDLKSLDFDDDLKSLDDILGDLEQELITDFFNTWRWFLLSQISPDVQ